MGIFSDLDDMGVPVHEQTPTLVPEGKKFRWSASQVETFKLCPRKWGFQKLYQLKTPPTKALARGSQMHAWLEQYLKDGTTPTEETEQLFRVPDGLEGEDLKHAEAEAHIWQDLWKRAEMSLVMLPEPGVAEVEGKMQLWIEDHEGLGFVDFHVPDQGKYRGRLGYTPQDPDKAVPLVGDHKSSSDPSRYAKGPEDLERDAQANIYATWILLKTGAEHVDLFWNYVATRNARRCVPVRVRWTREQVEQQMEDHVVPYLLQMADIWYARPDWEDIPANTNACDAFGGCPFQSLCNISPFKGLGEKNMPTMQEVMAKRKAKSAAPTEEAAGLNPPDAAPEAAPVEKAAPEPEPAPAPAKKKATRKKKAAAPKPEPTPVDDVRKKAAAPKPEPAPVDDGKTRNATDRGYLSETVLRLVSEGQLEHADRVLRLLEALR